MLEVHIETEMKARASAHSTERLRYEFDRFALPKDQRLSMILIGTIGQLVFKKFLDQENVLYDYEFQAGKFDEFDFKVGNSVIEVKTSGYCDDFSKLNLLYSHSQFCRGLAKDYKYCVQIFVDGYERSSRLLNLDKVKTATLAGFVRYSDIANFKQSPKFLGDDYRVPLRNLENIAHLLPRIRDN